MLIELIKDFVQAVRYFIESNLRSFATLLNTALPYIMYFVGQAMFNERHKISIGFEIFIPIVVCLIIYFIKSYANRIGKGITIPTPSKRFTEVSDDGEVSIKNERVQELILYTADLEDWLERKGLL